MRCCSLRFCRDRRDLHPEVPGLPVRWTSPRPELRQVPYSRRRRRRHHGYGSSRGSYPRSDHVEPELKLSIYCCTTLGEEVGRRPLVRADRSAACAGFLSHILVLGSSTALVGNTAFQHNPKLGTEGEVVCGYRSAHSFVSHSFDFITGFEGLDDHSLATIFFFLTFAIIIPLSDNWAGGNVHPNETPDRLSITSLTCVRLWWTFCRMGLRQLLRIDLGCHR